MLTDYVVGEKYVHVFNRGDPSAEEFYRYNSHYQGWVGTLVDIFSNTGTLEIDGHKHSVWLENLTPVHNIDLYEGLKDYGNKS